LVARDLDSVPRNRAIWLHLHIGTRGFGTIPPPPARPAATPVRDRRH
jgi:hypothetical protein